MKTIEIWKDIPNYEGTYQVSNLGRVKSLERIIKGKNDSFKLIKEKIRKNCNDGKGYLSIIICLNYKIKRFNIHQLVAMAFLGHEPCGHKLVVDHINGIKTDNRVENLQIITQRENLSKDKKGYTSKYTGVSWAKNINKWVSQIEINGIKMCLGNFNTELEAHLVYQEKLKKQILT